MLLLLGWAFGPGHADAVLVSEADSPVAIVVVGAPGAPEYETNFLHQALLWSNLTQRAGAKLVQIGGDIMGEGADLDRLRQSLADQSRDSRAALWLVLIGVTYNTISWGLCTDGDEIIRGVCTGFTEQFRA